MTENGALVAPGDSLGQLKDGFVPGAGTYEAGGKIVASLVGFTALKEKDGLKEISVSQQKSRSSVAAAVPEKGSTVIARITKINPRFASAEILLVGDRTLHEAFSGIIRSQDVRTTDVDNVQVENCFRPGDIVRAQVIELNECSAVVEISLGDRRAFYLSTAGDNLGVIAAVSRAGGRMKAVDEYSMECELTGAVEKRKVAMGEKEQ